MVNGDSSADNGGEQPSGVELLDRLKQYLVGIAAILTVVAQLWSAVENQWKLGAITLLLVVVLFAFYAISHRVPAADRRQAEILRFTMIGLLIAIPFVSLVGLYTYSYLPRTLEPGTTIAVARFAGPPALPSPYEDCRPSDMLVHTLMQVGTRFGGLRAFELPYTIDPDNRWAEFWATAHGSFEGADVIVYGEFTLYSTRSDGKPDEIVINPAIARVPMIPLGFKSSPLYTWDFSGTVAPIRALCGSDLQEAGNAPRFLDDARRIAVAIVGLQALGRQDFEIARDALDQAETPDVAQREECKGDSSMLGTAAKSLCPGVLAFYLAMLDARLGNYARALQEYTYAAGRLENPAPFLNLGELYSRLGETASASEEFDRAVEADPNSVAAIATRAAYERDDLQPHRAELDLYRAMQLRPSTLYDRLVISRAIYQRGGKGDAACGATLLGEIVHSWGFDDRQNVATLVEYGTWLRASHSPAAIDELGRALTIYPNLVAANYQLGLALEESNVPGERATAAYYFRRAEYAPAYTDDDFLNRANAASELVTHFDVANSSVQHADYALAIDSYKRSISLNHGAVYAYLGKGLLERNSPKAEAADLQTAARLRPNDAMVQSTFAQFLDATNHRAEATAFHARAKADILARIPADDQAAWSPQACRYRTLGATQ